MAIQSNSPKTSPKADALRKLREGKAKKQEDINELKQIEKQVKAKKK